MKFIISLFVFLLVLSAQAADLGFRYKDGICQNAQGVKGLNPSYFGVCADFKNAVLGRIQLDGIDFSGSDFTQADLQKSSLNKTNLTGVHFDNANLSGVQLNDSIIHQTSFQAATLKNLTLTGADLVSANFSGADLRGTTLSYFSATSSDFTSAKFAKDALDHATITKSDFSKSDLSGCDLTESVFEDSVFKDALLAGSKLIGSHFKNDTLSGISFGGVTLRGTEFAESNLSGASFRDSTYDSAVFSHVDLTGADFRNVKALQSQFSDSKLTGARFNKRSTLPFSTMEAQGLGMIFINSRAVLFLWDTKTAELTNFFNYLNSSDVEVTYSQVSGPNFDGSETLANYDVVIHFNGSTYNQDMKPAGQQALVDYVSGGGIYISAEWNSYGFQVLKHFQMMKDLIILQSQNPTSGTAKFAMTTDGKTSPMLTGITDFSADSSFAQATLVVFPTDPSVNLMSMNGNYVGVGLRNFKKGHIVALGIAPTYSSNAIKDANVRKIILNAVNGLF